MYTHGYGTPKDALRAVQKHASRVKKRNNHGFSGKNIRKSLNNKAPMRCSIALKLKRPASGRAKLLRAMYMGFLFGIIGGGIGLLATGTGIRSGYWTTTGLVIAACFGLSGAVIGYLSKKTE